MCRVVFDYYSDDNNTNPEQQKRIGIKKIQSISILTKAQLSKFNRRIFLLAKLIHLLTQKMIATGINTVLVIATTILSCGLDKAAVFI